MLIPVLAVAGIFPGLEPAQLTSLSGMLFEKQVQKDEVLFKQGDPASIVYMVQKGQILIRYKPYDGDELTVGTIGPDGILGWSAALGHPRYTSRAVAVEDSTLLAIYGTRLRCLCLKQPETGAMILDRLASGIAGRLQSTEALVHLLSSEIEYNEHCLERKIQHG
ncbi:MAG TPA: cyclic nucleotide-binding domain-containing protein [Anaerolineaceae bacterium]|nr:cyclic nucleotide-binding domain-containing protein [Anaerolineaceae bacterium]